MAPGLTALHTGLDFSKVFREKSVVYASDVKAGVSGT